MLNWFLRDFGYDSELLERNEIDEMSHYGHTLTHLGLSGI